MRLILHPLKKVATTVCVLLVFSVPVSANAANIFGGKVGAFLPCMFNIPPGSLNTVGAPRGGIYIWSPLTKTFNGPPAPGKWVIGTYGIPYFCLINIAPLFVLPGISMVMVGTSK